jgi:hypothetical protein
VIVAPTATDHEALTNARSQIGCGCSAILGGSIAEPIWLGAALVHSVLKAGSEIYAMTGVLAIRCNVQVSCEARQRSLVSFGLFREPMEQLMGGAWRLHTMSVVKLDFPNRSGRRKQSQRRLSTGSQALVLLHAQAVGRRELGGRDASFSRHRGRREVWEG